MGPLLSPLPYGKAELPFHLPGPAIVVRSWNLVSLSVGRNGSESRSAVEQKRAGDRPGFIPLGLAPQWSKTGGVEEGDVNVWHGASAALAAFGSPPSPLWDWSYGTSLSAARPWWTMTLLKLEGLTKVIMDVSKGEVVSFQFFDSSSGGRSPRKPDLRARQFWLGRNLGVFHAIWGFP
ncbi:hypothetical protein CNYM01_13687 [Colletotrichum nymphaeae SA-01]|uniref:Uncharacterized protein n=1 Tax=Colletotrichum nymphaeae SA-01 TaxID=1460502 RepID=A0A135UW83_9PEZI|nr:hypothetical protein CNYM01_13687 [Colletotrichum nymphaeae SA-01]